MTLRAGWNTLLAKVVNGAGEHKLYLRITGDPTVRNEAVRLAKPNDP